MRSPFHLRPGRHRGRRGLSGQPVRKPPGLHGAILGLALLAITVPATRAETAQDPVPVFEAGDRIDLRRAVAIALDRNPGVQSLKLRHEGMLERPRQVAALPDPMFAYTHMFEDVVTANGPSSRMVELSQEFPFRGKRPLRAGISQAEADAVEQQWLTARLEVSFAVRSVYYDLYRIDRSTEIIKEESGVLDRLERTARARYAAGQVSQGDVLRAQTDRSRIEERLLTLRQEREAAEARFNASLGRPQTAPVGRADEPPDGATDLPPDEVLLTLARELRPEVAEARSLMEANQLRTKLARREFYPDFRIGLQWNQIDPSQNPMAPDSGQDAYMVTVGVSLPIWRDKLHAGLLENQDLAAAAGQEVQDRGNLAESQARAVMASVRAQRDLASLFETTLIPQAESSLRAAEAAYQTGGNDFLAVLDSERSLLGLRLNHRVAEGELGKAVAALQRAVGLDLDDIRTAAVPPQPEGGSR